MKMIRILIALPVLFGPLSSIAQPDDFEKQVRHADSLFWIAYNQCDVDKMAAFFTDDLEFYHDKGGLTTPKTKLVASMTTGLCGNENWRLRREPVEGTVQVFRMNNIGAIMSGQHVFYILEKDKEPVLDGLARFTHVWVWNDDEWKMSRVLSYDHGPATYQNKRQQITLSSSQLKSFTGKFGSPKSGVVTIQAEQNALQISSGDFQIVLYPEKENVFFAKEKDLVFQFDLNGKKPATVSVIEKGKVVDECKRLK
jgi:hypothetical protein